VYLAVVAEVANRPTPAAVEPGQLLQALRPVSTEFRLAPELASIVRPVSSGGAARRLCCTSIGSIRCLRRRKPKFASRRRRNPRRADHVQESRIDPTKTRPSNEALLRRVRKGDAIPRIKSAVDVINWCSLEFQLPYGLYDSSRFQGP
jgi:hypothetical protein